MAAPPTGTVTFLFTDIAGSTRLPQQLGDRYAEVLDAHHRLLSAAVQEAQGQVLETQGDAVFAVFPRARDAMRILWSLGLVAFDQHNFEEAHSQYKEGLRTAKELGNVWFGVFLVEAFAGLIAAEGQYVRAARLFGAAEAHRKITGLPLPLFHRSDYDRPVAIIRAGLKEEAFSATWAEGRAMTLEQAIEYALAPELS
jgi:class 3 adenylate cyclase